MEIDGKKEKNIFLSKKKKRGYFFHQKQHNIYTVAPRNKANQNSKVAALKFKTMSRKMVKGSIELRRTELQS